MPPMMQLLDDIHHISNHIANPALRIPNQHIAGLQVEDQQSSIDMDSNLLHSTVTSLVAFHPVILEQFCTVDSSGADMTLLFSTIEDSMPDHWHQIPSQLRDYRQIREHLHNNDSVGVYKDRIFIPPSLKQQCLATLHAAHQGVSWMISKAGSSIFGPAITNNIHATRSNCSDCNRMALCQVAILPTPPVITAYQFHIYRLLPFPRYQLPC